MEHMERRFESQPAEAELRFKEEFGGIEKRLLEALRHLEKNPKDTSDLNTLREEFPEKKEMIDGAYNKFMEEMLLAKHVVPEAGKTDEQSEKMPAKPFSEMSEYERRYWAP
ncbi:MAG: hypothetical protein COW88_02035 [Candidatus Lloydbacteria bacterium CG22_combo_CG10-13_8_21_14_all_47_15]|uniref:Uncharacterized protein n=1 Tax=Candidatus Lloydbacteria bacterium CG22_combo_CG10-13_8_21_14_all_47_15 TaxID=1974635 RepID=A0A2H0CU38_9BACT|nr:MAG: hypothetical protein COW88_02035 [Candidatus Lloydbacteria bacterium CG22_combo_CG10-13_8_21_14_all_47_15]